MFDAEGIGESCTHRVNIPAGREGALSSSDASRDTSSVPTRPMTSPQVGVIMGSDSDLPVMQGAVDALDDFGIPHEVRIVSAHRTPEVMVDYARTAVQRGLKVIIAGAGGAAHLPGMTASLTPLPVIGVPVPLDKLDGLDSLLSIVQMPAGVPVATVAVGNARNAGLLAARILATSDDELRVRMEQFQERMAEMVVEKDARVRKEHGSAD
jgi:5-(carboxyamino)imidazole ribonucleotide mutase